MDSVRRELSTGLSPRVRGNQQRRVRMHCEQRSIPACAGEPPARRAPPKRPGVYPRVCGGTLMDSVRRELSTGLSPRVRGNPVVPSLAVPGRGSIPACAGEPMNATGESDMVKVYPRVCGGTDAATEAVHSAGGLSPRVRGNLSGVAGAEGAEGSIPACAGEPTWTPWPTPGPRVYPRVCGGTPKSIGRYGLTIGLSPRVRGNPPGC